MKTVARALLLLGAMMLLAACSGGTPSYGSANEVAKSVGCTDFAAFLPLTSFTIGTAWWESGDDALVPANTAVRIDAGRCTYHGDRLGIWWASEPGVLDTYFFELGPKPTHLDRILSSPTWVIRCATSADCLALQRTTGARLGAPPS